MSRPDPEMTSNPPTTLFQKIWDAHTVTPETVERPAVLYVDLHLIHEVTSPQAFAALAQRGLEVRRPERVLATMDHSTPTTAPLADGSWPGIDPQAGRQLATLEANCRAHGIELFDGRSQDRGIVHVVGPELGATWPGATVVCGDSHTSTHGAFGALAFGIGTSEVAHVLATQCLLQRRARSMSVELVGTPPADVSAKDLILAVLGTIGVDGGTGHVIEYRGAAVEALGMEGRMTLCNMSIEGGARAGLVAPDDTTFAWLEGRPKAPQGKAWERALDAWRELRTDAGAAFDKRVQVDVAGLAPQITFGTHPGMVMPITGVVPDVPGEARELEYMGLAPGEPLQGRPIDVVFVGSCTNGRLDDLRAAAAVLRGRKVSPKVRTLVVPGSHAVRRAAEAEGLDEVFRAAGAEWREPGCSMCIAMNGDFVAAGRYAVSTSNRNFRGRQGAGSRTFLASPATAAASAITGEVTDPRGFLTEATIHA